MKTTELKNVIARELGLKPGQVAVRPLSVVELNAAFQAVQDDQFNPVASVLWVGDRVILYVRENDAVKSELANMSAEGVIRKIKLWCVKNHYRCPQLRDNLIYL